MVVLIYTCKIEKTEAQKVMIQLLRNRVRIKTHRCLKSPQNGLFPPAEGRQLVFFLDKVGHADGTMEQWPEHPWLAVLGGPEFTVRIQEE